MNLLDYFGEQQKEKESPLASRLRPRTLDEIVGQEHIIGKDTLLYRAVRADKLSSIILYGPPGTGKTTLAKVIANTTQGEFLQINATSAGKRTWELMEKRLFCLLTRSTALTKDSRIICFRSWKTEQSYSLVPPRKILILR